MNTKILFSFAIVFVAQLTMAQMPDTILYRGINNEVKLSDYGYDAAQFEIQGLENVKLTMKSLGVYTALPHVGKKVKLLVLDAKSHPVDTLSFHVLNCPIPVLYLCGVEEGMKTDLQCDTLELRYPEGVRLEHKFSIVSWELSHPDLPKNLSGTSNIIEGLAAIRDQLKPNTAIEINLMYADEYNVMRKIVARWSL
jgi:hypothetical protein